MSDLPLDGNEALDFINQCNLGLAYLDLETLEILFLNETAARLLGRTAKDLRGAHFLSIVEVRYHEEVSRVVPRLAAGEQDVVEDARLIHGDGSSVYMEIHAGPITYRGRASLSCLLHEVTQRRKVEKELRKSEERFKTIFNCSRDGLLAADPETQRFVLANDAMCEMVGYTEEELLALGVTDIHPEDELPRVKAAFEGQVRGDFTLSPDLRVKRKDGSILFAQINSYVVELDGHPLLLGNFRDVTERRRLGSHLAQADRMASLGLLAAGVAHEVNNPLTYVLYNAETLAEQLPRLLAELRARTAAPGATDLSDLLAEAHEMPAMCEEAHRGLLQVRDIIRDLKRFSRVEEDERGPVEVNAALESAVRMALNQIKYRARLVRDLGTVPLVTANEGRLCQVFLNLLVNAAQAIDEGAPDDNTITLRTLCRSGEVCVEVRDTGRGATAEAQEKLFDPFYSTREGELGAGMGLSISRSIVTSLGGRIEATGTPGKGTCMTVYLPVDPAATDTPDASKTADGASEESAPAEARILVVDDEPQVAKVMGRMLRRANYQVSTVTSVEAAQACITAGEIFDLIICDLMMPGLTGMDLYAWLESGYPELCRHALFITGGVFTPRAERFLSQPSIRWLEKPIDRALLFKTMEELLKG